ncbi:MAG: binding-protein-dependent transport system inner rane component [Armatimonadetes bacterium]|jgi:multiple sugar transport system permease protein|nr:binding-protein-dependent transport system inner rane component [Armatimonadota bacterium]
MASPARRVWRKRFEVLLTQAALLACSVVFVIPLYWLVSSSLKTDSQLHAWPPVWVPSPITTEHYVKGLQFIPFPRMLLNTLIVAIGSVIGTVISCSLVAYSLAMMRWKGRDFLFYMLLATMMLPGQVTMVPLFVLFAKMGWVDTFLPLVVPHFFGGAFSIFLLRQFFLGIPRDLSEAARIDGCGPWGIYQRIVLPLSKPVVATVSLFTFLAAWNDYMGPLIYLANPRNFTLSLGLAMFNSQYGSYPGQLMAVTTVMTLPILVLFFLTQRTFIQGMSTSGIKG